MRNLVFLTLAGLLFLIATPLVAGFGPFFQDPVKQEENTTKKPTPQDKASYVGAAVCRNCHRSKAKGEQFVHWLKKTIHPNAYKTLMTPKAKEIAAKAGLGDPTKEDACLKCHVTAHGVDPKKKRKTFKHQYGVQCESCHGPGSAHQTARIKGARDVKTDASGASLTTLDIPPGEIRLPTEADCRSCHNPESPTYKEYHHKEFLSKVAHPNPQRKRDDPQKSENP